MINIYKILRIFILSMIVLTVEALPATEKGDWITRLRGLYVHPNDHSGSLSTIPHSGVSVHNSFTGEFDFGYMFTKYIGSELILATSKHSLVGKKALQGTKIGTTWILPPTLMIQGRFFPSSRAQPYLGAGVNYSLFYHEHCSIANTHLKLSHSWGPAVQAGMDIFCSKKWFINLDVKYVWIRTKARLTGHVPGTVHVDVDPWLMGIGFGRTW